jgi:hypothetical protein
MVRPSSFRKNEETAANNYYQKDVNHDHAAALAVDEFDAMVEQLEDHGVHVMVIEDDPSTDTPDALFPNNWVSFHSDGRVGLYPMYAPNRRAERREDILHDLEHNHGFSVREVLDFTEFEDHGAFLEGTGSVVLDRIHGKAYAAWSERTDRDAFEQFCETMDLEGIAFEAFQSVGTERKPIYHTNVMMAIGTGWAAVCLDCMDHPEDQDLVKESLASDGLTVIELSEDQIQSFAGNMLEVRGTDNQPLIVMSSRAYRALEPTQIASLSAFGTLIHIPLDTIETCGGGSARCMMAEVHLPLQTDTTA